MSPEPTGRRTSPRIVLVHTVTFRQARQFVPAVIPLLAATGVGDGGTTVIALVIGVTLLSLATAALSWWRFTYADGPTAVVVTRGLLSRSVRTVPLDRIRGVEVETPVLHRLFGLVRVRIDAAAGGVTGKDEEIVVDGVPLAEGDRLRTAVLTRRATPAPTGGGSAEAEPAEEEFARFDPHWLLYAPLVGSYLAVPLAAVGALFRLVDELPRRFRPEFDGPDVFDGRVIGLGILVVLLLLTVGSVVGAALVNWRFRLVRRGGSLIAVRGLITRRHTELEIDRIRGCTLSEGLGMRLVGAARVSALVTGLGDAARRGQLLPLGPRTKAWELVHRLVEDPGPLAPHPPAARRRRLVRAVTPGLLFTLAGAVATLTDGSWWVLVVGVSLTALGVPLGLGRYASLGHATGARSFSVRSGWLVREQAVVERRAVVGWRVRQSFFQRRAGLATVMACVGAGAGGYSAVDLAADEVATFAAAASGPWADTLAPSAGDPLPAGPKAAKLSEGAASVRCTREEGSVAMSEVHENQPEGTPTWMDLGVPDLDRAMEFYGSIFGWEFDVGPEEYGRYTTCLLKGRRVAAMSPQFDPSAGVFWNVYLATDDCDRTVEKAREAGGTVLVEPMDVMEQGRMAIVRDPVGAQFGLWQGRAHTGAEVVNEPGALVRNDLVTPTPGPAREFYAQVFGFTLDGNEDMPEADFTFLRRPDGHEVGGIMGAPGSVSGWQTTFEVADTDDVVRRAREAGGTTEGAKDFLYGRLATITDPFGAQFSVITRPAG